VTNGQKFCLISSACTTNSKIIYGVLQQFLFWPLIFSYFGRKPKKSIFHGGRKILLKNEFLRYAGRKIFAGVGNTLLQCKCQVCSEFFH
jgi:hypothetical protein